MANGESSAVDELMDDAIEMAETEPARPKTGGKKSKSLELSNHHTDMGAVDTLRHTVLSLVTAKVYDRAARELLNYVELKAEYPQFKSRTARYVSHCQDLISAIKTKKSIPGLNFLSMSKQQELHERAVQHLEELNNCLKSIEAVEREMRLSDIRSTIWVVKAAVISMTAIIVCAFAQEFYSSTLYSANVVLDQFTGDAIDKLFKFLGL